ncbi:cupin domain-containing protein [Geodermatophilus sp. SYSU D00703]
MTLELQPVDLTVVDTTTAEWVGFPIPELGVDLELIPLVDDPDTGMQVVKVVYRAGSTNVWHTHPCAHGMYVLEGTLETHQGSYGPGSFVCSPKAGSWSTAPPTTPTASSCSSPTSPSGSTTPARAPPQAARRTEGQGMGGPRARRSPPRRDHPTASHRPPSARPPRARR